MTELGMPIARTIALALTSVANGQTRNSEVIAETCQNLAVKSAVDNRCAVRFAKQALIAQHIDPSI